MRDILLGVCRRKKENACEAVYLSQSVLRRLGYTAESFQSEHKNSYLELLDQDYRDHFQSELARQQPGKQFSIEYLLRTKNGEQVHVREISELVKEDGAWYFYSELMDLPAFFSLNRHYCEILDALPLPVFLADEHRNLIFINQEMSVLSGIDPAEAVGKPCSIFQMSACGTARCGIVQLEKGDKTTVNASYNNCNYQIHTARLTASDPDGAQGYICIGAQCDDSHHMLQQVQRMYDRYRIAVAQTRDIVWEYSHGEDLLSCFLSGQEKPYVMQPRELIARHKIHPDSVSDFLALSQQVKQGETNTGKALKIQDAQGVYQWVDVSFVSQLNAEGKREKTVGVAREITEQKTAEMQYEQELEYRASMISGAMYYYEVNLTGNQVISGDFPEELSAGMSTARYTSLMRKIAQQIPDEGDQKIFHELMGRRELLEAFAQGKQEISLEYQRIGREGTLVWVATQVNLIKNLSNGDVCAYIHVKDIDEQKKKELQLRTKAERDPLTGLYNREAARGKINRLLVADPDLFSALLMIDIDNFKLVNDLFGHVYGDAVLCELSQRLMRIVRDGDIVCRIGGDELCVFLHNMKGGSATVCKKAEEICTALNTVYTSEDSNCEVSCSIGIAFVPEDGICFADLYEKADIALYHAKNMGKNRYVIYGSGLSAVAQISRRTEGDDELSGTFEKSAPEYIFKILYNSSNLDITIPAVLELLARHYNAQRGYLYEFISEADGFVPIYEWTEGGTSTHKQMLEQAGTCVSNRHWKCFDGDDVFASSQKGVVPIEATRMAQITGSKATLQYPIRQQGEFYGFIGIDDLFFSRTFHEDECSNMRICAQIIGTFMAGKRLAERQNVSFGSMKKVLDHLEHYVYVVDEKSWDLLFMNQMMAKNFYETWQEKKCYQLMFDRKDPCEDCVMRRAQIGEKIEKELIKSADTGRWFEISVARIEWPDGKKACLVDSTDVSRYHLGSK